jgi:hypothetical protein
MNKIFIITMSIFFMQCYPKKGCKNEVTDKLLMHIDTIENAFFTDENGVRMATNYYKISDNIAFLSKITGVDTKACYCDIFWYKEEDFFVEKKKWLRWIDINDCHFKKLTLDSLFESVH